MVKRLSIAADEKSQALKAKAEALIQQTESFAVLYKILDNRPEAYTLTYMNEIVTREGGYGHESGSVKIEIGG